MSTIGKTLKFRAAKLKGFTVFIICGAIPFSDVLVWTNFVKKIQ